MRLASERLFAGCSRDANGQSWQSAALAAITATPAGNSVNQKEEEGNVQTPPQTNKCRPNRGIISSVNNLGKERVVLILPFGTGGGGGEPKGTESDASSSLMGRGFPPLLREISACFSRKVFREIWRKKEKKDGRSVKSKEVCSVKPLQQKEVFLLRKKRSPPWQKGAREQTPKRPYLPRECPAA